MNVRFVVIGRPSPAYRTIINDYEKRLPKYCRFEVFEVKKEDEIIGKLKGTIVIMDKDGKQMSSEGFATWLKTQENLTFVIGGDTGLSDKIKQQSNILLSFSLMTFPHQLARLMLTEQVYRALTILKGEKYHK